MKNDLTVKRSVRVAMTGLLVALALVLGWVEHMIPISAALPGIKLGLANLAVVLAIYTLGWRAAVCVAIMKPLLSALLFAGMSGLIFSLSGAMLSLAVMLILFRASSVTAVGCSAAGGAAHMIGQVLAAMMLTGTVQIWRVLPLLLLSGGLAGAVIGWLAAIIMRRAGAWAKEWGK